jgi:disease resistance protein RPM1
LLELPEWITELDALTKLTLPVTVLTTHALHRLSKLQKLFSLTFSLTSAKQDAENKTDSDRQIRVPAGGFEELKLLRFSAPFMPLLRFPANAMPKLQRLELRFSNFEGMYGIEYLQDLKEVHVRVHDKAGNVTNFIVDQMATSAREDDNGPRMIVDQYHE